METARGMDLAQMKEVDIHTVDRESLVDIRDVQVDGKLPGSSVFRFPAADKEPLLLPLWQGGGKDRFFGYRGNTGRQAGALFGGHAVRHGRVKGMKVF